MSLALCHEKLGSTPRGEGIRSEKGVKSVTLRYKAVPGIENNDEKKWQSPRPSWMRSGDGIAKVEGGVAHRRINRAEGNHRERQVRATHLHGRQGYQLI